MSLTGLSWNGLQLAGGGTAGAGGHARGGDRGFFLCGLPAFAAAVALLRGREAQSLG